MNTTPVLNPTPKARFQESGDSISKHRDMVDSATFQRACDYAILEYSRIISQEVIDGNSGATAGLRLRGAHEIIQLLRNLSEKPAAPPATTPISVLNHRA